MVKRAFSFLDMPSRSEKPRVDGMTMCIDQGLGFDFVKGLLEMSSDYIDLWKLGWTTTQLQELKLVKKKISLLRSHQISVCNGGTLLELSEHQGKSTELFRELVDIVKDPSKIRQDSVLYCGNGHKSMAAVSYLLTKNIITTDITGGLSAMLVDSPDLEI